jgi:hypothetical protein
MQELFKVEKKPFKAPEQDERPLYPEISVYDEGPRWYFAKWSRHCFVPHMSSFQVFVIVSTDCTST